ncbi:MAG TPA: FtsX-like permease family protein [Galbitalea sp.]|nr:FtsX-like permease family protein [Galbitalea sp.]
MRLPLALKGLYWRRWTSVAILLTAAVTTGAAALGPIYAMSASESTLRDELTLAPSQDSGLHYEQSYYLTGKNGNILRIFARYQKDFPKAGSIKGYPRTIQTLYWETGAAANPTPGALTGMVWRQGDCAHLNIVKGTCPTGPGQAIVSRRSVDSSPFGWKLGGTLTLKNDQTVKIVGLYTPKNASDPFWYGHNYFDATAATNTTPNIVDSIFVTKSEFGALHGHMIVRAYVDYPLDPAQIRLADVPKLKQNVAALRSHLPMADGYPLANLTTSLNGVLASAAHEQQLVDTGTLLVTLQLALLGWFVLFQVVADAAEARGSEIALAKLRGHRVAQVFRFGLAEPLVLLLIAIPIGGVIAVLAAEGFAHSVLVPGTPVQVTWQAGAAALGAFAGGVIAAGLAARRVLRRSVLDQWRRTTSAPPHTRTALIVDIVLAAAAVIGLVILQVSGAIGGGDDTAALLAPGLLVLALALVGTRLMPLLVRAFLPLTRATASVAAFIATRQVVRRPAGLRLAALLAVALGLATFGVGAETVAIGNRTARADGEFGASQVVSFEYTPGVDPISAVRKADPDGTWAMAAATWLPDGGNSVNGTVLAVDASRLAAVGFPARGGPSTANIASVIATSKVPALVVHATKMSAVVDASGMRPNATPQVQFNLRSLRGVQVDAESSVMQPGKHTYTASIPCADGCTFLGITWDRPVFVSTRIVGQATVESLSAGTTTVHPLAALLTQKAAWRANVAQGNAADHVHATSAGVVDNFSSHDGGYGGVAYAFVPARLPAVVTPGGLAVPTTSKARMSVVDGFSVPADFVPSEVTTVVPHVLNEGVVMNLSYLQDDLPDFNNEAIWQVWVSPSAPSDAVARLRAAGISVQSTSAASTRIAELARQAPALSLLLLLASAIAGSVLAIGGTTISIGSSARRRSYEAAALGTVGVSRRRLYRAALYEQLIVLGTAVVLGVGGGVLAAVLTLPVIPEFATGTPVQLVYLPTALPLLLSTVGFAILVLAAAAGTSGAVLRSARAARLREAEE